MAIDYTALFTRIGRFVHEMNGFTGLQGTDLLGADSGADDVLDEYEDDRDLVNGVQQAYESWAGAVRGWMRQLNQILNRTFASLQTELAAPSSTPAVVLPLLAERMTADSESVDANTVSVSSITPGAANVGSGLLVADLTTADAVNDERVIVESVLVQCVIDQFTGTAVGAEQFMFVGQPAVDPTSYLSRGSGSGMRMAVADSTTVLTNGTFEGFAVADTPDSWDIDAGVAGTHIFQIDVSHCGDLALEFRSNATQATIGVSQEVSSGLAVNTKYVAAVWLRKSAAMEGTSNLKVSIYSADWEHVLFDGDPNTLSTDYALKHVFFWVPGAMPDSVEFRISWTSADGITATRAVYMDDAVLSPVYAFGHVHYAAFRGDDDFQVGDLFEAVTANDYAGTFQTFFGRFYDVLLPSAAGGVETIDDALAE